MVLLGGCPKPPGEPRSTLRTRGRPTSRLLGAAIVHSTYSHSMSKFRHGDVALAYDDTGETDLVPLLLLHGLSSSRSTWSRLTAALRGRFRILALDDRGHGESDHASGSYLLPRYTSDAVAFLEQMSASPAVLIGHSLGGVIAATMAQQRPDLVRGVVLEDPPLFAGQRGPGTSSPILQVFSMMRQILVDMQSQSGPIADYEALMHAAPSASGRGSMAEVFGEDSMRAQARAMAALDPEIFTTAIDGTALADARPDIPLGCPALVVRADPALGAEFTLEDETRFLSANPSAAVTVFEGASHLIHDEQPESFIAVVKDFLARLTR
jgi:pimeloyl-ACP methyl ester carboxylesterase